MSVARPFAVWLKPLRCYLGSEEKLISISTSKKAQTHRIREDRTFMKRIQSSLRRGFGRLSSKHNSGWTVLILGVVVCGLLVVVPTAFLSSGLLQKVSAPSPGGAPLPQGVTRYVSQAVGFHETPALRDVAPIPITPEEREKFEKEYGLEREKNEENARRVKPDVDSKKTAPFVDQAVNNLKHAESSSVNVITNPIQNFDGPDADTGQPLFGTRFIPPDTNAAVGPNHVIAITNMGLRIYDKVGNPLVAQFRLSQLLAGVPNAGDDDGDPIAVYDKFADPWSF